MPGRGNVRVSITADADQLGRETRRAESHIDRFSRGAGKGMKNLGGAAGVLDSRLGKVAKAASLVGGAYMAIAEAKDAINVTTELAKSTLTLNKSFGLTVKQASEWSAVAKARGADGKALTMGFKALATATRNANVSGGAALQVFNDLGISQKELAAAGHDTGRVLTLISDGLATLPAGTEKSAIAAKLFGRTWTSIAPIIRDGSKDMREQLGLASEYGATFGGKSLKSMQDFIKAQREARLATLGLQVTFGTALAPALTKIIPKIAHFVNEVRLGRGQGGKFRETLDQMAQVVRQAAPAVVGLVRVLGSMAPVLKLLRFTTVGFLNFGVRKLIEVLPTLGRTASTVFGKVKSVVVDSMDKVLGAFSSFLRAIDKASHAVPVLSKVTGGLGDKAGHAADDIDKLRENIRDLKSKEITVGVKLDLRPPSGIVSSGDPKTAAERLKATVHGMAQTYVNDHPFIQSPLGQLSGGGRFKGGTWKWANQIAALFGLHATSSYRTPSHNAAVGGVPGSLHTHGSLANPGAIDMVGPVGQMNAAAAWARAHIRGIQEVLVHDAGSGLHLHLGFFQRGGTIPGRGTGDTVPAMLTPGEEVIRAPVAKRIRPLLKLLNAQQFQKGGTVGPGGIPRGDWNLTKQIGGRFHVDPLLLVAIGLHETGWGKLGDGRNGNVLGVGSYDSGSSYKWAGLRNQLTQGSKLLQGWGVHSLGDVLTGKASAWATDPGWESAIARWYRQIASPAWRRSRGNREGQHAPGGGGGAGGGGGGGGGGGTSVPGRQAYEGFDQGDSGGSYGWGGRTGWQDSARSRRLRARQRRREARGPRRPVDVEGVLGEFTRLGGQNLDAAAALAALTDTKDDDIAAATQAISFWSSWLDVAKANNDPGSIASFATNLKSAQDNLADLTAKTEEQNDLIQQQLDATTAHTAALTEHNTLIKQNQQLAEAQGNALMAAFLQWVNGGLGSTAGRARQFPGGSPGLGSLARI